MTDEEIGMCLRLKQLRKKLKLNQTDFGNRIEVAQGYLTNIETCRQRVTEKIFKLICLQSWDGKKVNEEWLRTGEGGDDNMFQEDYLEDEYATYAAEIGNGANDIIKAAIIKYGRLSPENKKIINDALDIMLRAFKEEISLEEVRKENESNVSLYDSIPDTPEELEAQYRLVSKHGKEFG